MIIRFNHVSVLRETLFIYVLRTAFKYQMSRSLRKETPSQKRNNEPAGLQGTSALFSTIVFYTLTRKCH